MNVENFENMKKRTKEGDKLIEKIEDCNSIIKAIDKKNVESAWIGSNLVHFEKNVGTSSIQGICTEKEAEELSHIITEYLINKVQKKKEKLEEKFNLL